MSSTTWYSRLKNSYFRPRARSRRPFRHRPRLERLEDRVVPTINPMSPFQIDGNATTEVTSPATHDWDQVFLDAGSPTTTAGGAFSNGALSKALAGTFVPDKTSIDTTYFNGGGSKDVNDINQWQWSNTSTSPDKNDVTDAYAAAYMDPTT